MSAAAELDTGVVLGVDGLPRRAFRVRVSRGDREVSSERHASEDEALVAARDRLVAGVVVSVQWWPMPGRLVAVRELRMTVDTGWTIYGAGLYAIDGGFKTLADARVVERRRAARLGREPVL